jgi:hypothetical protein
MPRPTEAAEGRFSGTITMYQSVSGRYKPGTPEQVFSMGDVLLVLGLQELSVGLRATYDLLEPRSTK